MEARAIRRVMGDTPVIAPSSYFGTIGAGAGAVELIASLMALERGQAPHVLNYERPDPECPIEVVAGAPREVTRSAAIKVRYSARGQAAALVVTRA
jgi:3-oxoacyl-[acyl-carrier-protein] synthase II